MKTTDDLLNILHHLYDKYNDSNHVFISVNSLIVVGKITKDTVIKNVVYNTLCSSCAQYNGNNFEIVCIINKIDPAKIYTCAISSEKKKFKVGSIIDENITFYLTIEPAFYYNFSDLVIKCTNMFYGKWIEYNADGSIYQTYTRISDNIMRQEINNETIQYIKMPLIQSRSFNDYVVKQQPYWKKIEV